MKKIIILLVISALVVPQLSSAAILTREQRIEYRAQYQALVKELQKIMALIETLRNRRLTVVPPASSVASTEAEIKKTAELLLNGGKDLPATTLDQEYSSLTKQLANDDSWAKLKTEILAATSSPEISQVLDLIDFYRGSLKNNPTGQPYPSEEIIGGGETPPPSLPVGADPYADPYTYQEDQSTSLLKNLFSKLPAMVILGQEQLPSQQTGQGNNLWKVASALAQADEADSSFNQAMAGLSNYMKYGSSGMDSSAGGGAQQIYESAKAAVAKPLVTKNVPGTEGGNLACAWAVSTVLQKGQHDVGIHRYTPYLKDKGVGKHTEKFQLVAGTGKSGTAIVSLAASPTANSVSTVLNQGKAGDVLISPTVGSKHGHTGICMADKCTVISSNSSKHKKYELNYTNLSWSAKFKNAFLYRSIK